MGQHGECNSKKPKKDSLQLGLIYGRRPHALNRAAIWGKYVNNPVEVYDLQVKLRCEITSWRLMSVSIKSKLLPTRPYYCLFTISRVYEVDGYDFDFEIVQARRGILDTF